MFNKSSEELSERKREKAVKLTVIVQRKNEYVNIKLYPNNFLISREQEFLIARQREIHIMKPKRPTTERLKFSHLNFDRNLTPPVTFPRRLLAEAGQLGCASRLEKEVGMRRADAAHVVAAVASRRRL